METWREELHADLYHTFKGREWKNHKYIRKEGNRYIYPEDIKPSSKSQKGWVSDTVSSIGNAAATAATSVGTAVSNAATSVANAVSDTWNTIASSVGTTATNLYNNISAAVANAITQHKDDVSWPKQKDQSDAHNRVGIAEKTSIPWNEKLNNYIKTRLAIIGDDKERLSDLYTAVSYLTYNHLNANGLLAKPATVSTPLHEGLDLASLAKAIDADMSDLTEDDVAVLTYALWGVLDAKMRGTKNPLVEGKGQIRDNLIDQIQGKPQQRQQLLDKVNSNKTTLAKPSASSGAKNSRSVVIKPGSKNLVHSEESEIYHHGILGQKWGVRRFQNPDGSLTEAGKKRYGKQIEKAYTNSKTSSENRQTVRYEMNKELASSKESQLYEKALNDRDYDYQFLRALEKGMSNKEAVEYATKVADKSRSESNESRFISIENAYKQKRRETANNYVEKYRDALLKDLGVPDTADMRNLLSKIAYDITDTQALVNERLPFSRKSIGTKKG